MAHIDAGDPELHSAVQSVRYEAGDVHWVVITYAPQRDNPSGNRLKVQATGQDYEDLRDEFDEGRAQFALYRHKVKEVWRYVFISWCGEGVQGMQKGRFGDHAIDMERWIAPFHVQINARNEDDVDLQTIILPRLYKALGADYDAGGLEQSTQKDGRGANLSSYHQKEDISAMQAKSAAFWSSGEAKASVQGSGYQKDTSFSAAAGASSKRNAFEELAKPAAAPEVQRTGRVFQPPKAAPAPQPVKAAPAPRPYQQAKAAPPPAAATPAAAPPPARSAPPPRQPDPEPEPEPEPEPAYHQEEYGGSEYHQEEAYYDESAAAGGYEEQGYDESAAAGGYEEQGYDESAAAGGYDEGYGDQGGYGEQVIRQVRAAYDFVGEGESDLSFYAGDVINVLDDSDDWYRGELNGAVGLFPSNFVEPI